MVSGLGRLELESAGTLMGLKDVECSHYMSGGGLDVSWGSRADLATSLSLSSIDLGFITQ